MLVGSVISRSHAAHCSHFALNNHDFLILQLLALNIIPQVSNIASAKTFVHRLLKCTTRRPASGRKHEELDSAVHEVVVRSVILSARPLCFPEYQ